MSNSVISLQNVRRYYLVGDYIVKALDGVNVEIAKGAFTAIMGPSGSGKSTMMNLIGCLDTPTSGLISIDGEYTNVMDEASLADLRNRKVGFVFQQFNLIAKQSALENVMTPLLYARVPYSERKEMAQSMLERVGLKDRMKHIPSELSGGQKQRVAIARALALEPEILLMDEPTSALDSEMVGEVLQIMRQLAAEGMTMLIVTHEMAFARDVASQVIFVDEGIIAEMNPPEIVFKAPENERTAEFLARFNNGR